MSPDLIVAIIAVFGAVAIVVAGAGLLWLERTAPEQRRLRALMQSAGGSGLVMDTPRLMESPDPMLAALTKLVPKSPKEISRLRRRLMRAGFPQLEAAVYYSLAELVL